MLFAISATIVTLVLASAALLFTRKFGKPYAIGVYIAALASAIVVAGKLGVVRVFGTEVILSASIFVFSATFLVTDVISELYGAKEARKAIWAGLALYAILFPSVWFAINLTPAAFYAGSGMQDAFATTMGTTVRIILASLAAFITAQLHDVWAYHFWKRRTGGKHLWLRNNASTAVSQLIDTIIFYTIGFYGIVPIIPLIIMTYVAKVIIAALDTPFIYGVVKFLRKERS